MSALFRRANVFLHMSQIEPFGIVYLEAAATGLPIVAPDLETPRWILGDTSLYANPQDTSSIAAALCKAILPETAEKLGDAARQRILDGWTWDAQASKYRDFIRELTGEKGPAEIQSENKCDIDNNSQLQHA